MRNERLEVVAIALTLVGAVAAVLWPVVQEASVVRRQAAGAERVVSLTALAEAGVWTDREVRAGNYWGDGFGPARPVLRVGEEVLLRLKSADVHHSFYAPELAVGPIDVKPGHVAEVRLKPEQPGLYPYYCTTVCGRPHFAMRGVIEVRQKDAPLAASTPAVEGRYWLLAPPADGASVVEQGRWLFYNRGCFTCHGWEGQGGVPNFNYVADTVPPLYKTANNLFLRKSEHVEAVIDLIERGIAVEEFEGELAIPRFFLVKKQYDNVKNLIRKGGVAGKKDVEGPQPPLEMPAWEQQLSDREIDSLIAFILTLERVDEETVAARIPDGLRRSRPPGAETHAAGIGAGADG
jgi:mono/diheme cytochrome c family protein